MPKFVSLNISVLIISDTRNESSDKSGLILEKKIKESGHKVLDKRYIKDEPKLIKEGILKILNDKIANVIILTGGTGLTGRDSTPDVLKTINSQLSFQNKIENNTSILKDLSMGGFDKLKMKKFANDNNLELKEYEISDLKQNEIFTEGIIKRIFLTKDGEVDLVTDSTLTKNFLVLGVKTQYKKIKKGSTEFEKYEAKARLNLINKIYETFDENLNEKYDVELNKRTIDRVKNSF